MPLPTSRELRKLLTEAAPGPWEVEELEQQWADCPPSVGFWVSGEDARYIASEEVLSEDYDQTERDFTLIALAPQLAEEVIRLRDEIEQITSSNGPWHRWFAWRPVRTRQHGWRWLQTVERALHYPDPLTPFAPNPYWVYRPTPPTGRT